MTDSNTITEKAVTQLKAYAKYIEEHAENIVGNIDKPNWVTEDGIRLSFRLVGHGYVPTLTVTKEHVVLDAVVMEGDGNDR